MTELLIEFRASADRQLSVNDGRRPRFNSRGLRGIGDLGRHTGRDQVLRQVTHLLATDLLHDLL
ncbi:MAG: hypothetical protein VX520_02100, partial [Planctomycetota bacterium]|nr:hypothetical protein [Planctomycetota bacterium]